MTEDGSLSLGSEERGPVAALSDAYAQALPDQRAAPYRALAAHARAGAVPTELLEALEGVCRISLETGKAREIGRAEAERVLLAVFRRTPGGRRAQAAVEESNRALAALAGRPLRAVRAAMRLPGRYTITLDVDGYTVTIGIGADGIGVETVGAG